MKATAAETESGIRNATAPRRRLRRGRRGGSRGRGGRFARCRAPSRGGRRGAGRPSGRRRPAGASRAAGSRTARRARGTSPVGIPASSGASAAFASAAKRPRSRPRTFASTTTRRIPFSRLTCMGPSTTFTEAISPSGTRDPPGAGTRSRSRAGTSLRASSGKRTTTANRRSPSTKVVTARPGVGRLEEVVDVGDVEAPARHRVAVEPDLDLGRPRDLLHLHVPRAGNGGEGRGGPVGEPLQDAEVGAEELHGEVALHPGDQLVHAQRDRLGERGPKAGHLREVAAHRLDELRLARGPGSSARAASASRRGPSARAPSGPRRSPRAPSC